MSKLARLARFETLVTVNSEDDLGGRVDNFGLGGFRTETDLG
jgi:hypothetical protein